MKLHKSYFFNQKTSKKIINTSTVTQTPQKVASLAGFRLSEISRTLILYYFGY
jgi:hypothetical protein